MLQNTKDESVTETGCFVKTGAVDSAEIYRVFSENQNWGPNEVVNQVLRYLFTSKDLVHCQLHVPVQTDVTFCGQNRTAVEFLASH